MGYHAKLGPSGAYWWSECTAGPGTCEGLPDDSNEAARKGTAEHQAAGECLESGLDPWTYLGRVMVFLNAREEMWIEDLAADRQSQIEYRVELNEEAIERVERYVNFVRDLVRLTGGVLLVEKRVRIGFITGEGYWGLNGMEVAKGTPGAVWMPAGGTADAIILTPLELIAVDYKSGQGRVDAYEIVRPESIDLITGEVLPAVMRPNKQLAMYAAGALHDYGWMGDFKRVRVIIVQPRLNATPEYALSVDELNETVQFLRERAEETRTNPTFRPSADTCQFCKARANCKAREDAVLSIALEGFVSGDVESVVVAKPRAIEANWLGALYDKLDMIQQWCGDVHARVYRALLNGQPVINSQGVALKLVEGRAGNRYWKNPETVAKTLLELGVPEDRAYKPRDVISPAEAEKLSKKKRGAKGTPGEPALLSQAAWDRLQAEIGQDEGKPSISLATDPKPAIEPRVAGFSDGSVSQPPVDLDLFS